MITVIANDRPEQRPSRRGTARPTARSRRVARPPPRGPAAAGRDGHDRAARGSARSRPIAATVNPWLSSTNTSGIAHAIAAAGTAADQRGQREREQRHGEGDLVEVEVDHLLQAPGEAVGERRSAGRCSARRARYPAVATGNTDTRGEQRLEEQQRRRRGEQPGRTGRCTATATWKWLPRRLNPGASMSTTGACSWRQLLDVLGVDAEVIRGQARAAAAGTAR